MEKIVNWLQTFPQWDHAVTVDGLQTKTGACGLYPMGIRVLDRKPDILGGERLRLQSRYQLRRTVASEEPKGCFLSRCRSFKSFSSAS